MWMADVPHRGDNAGIGFAMCTVALHLLLVPELSLLCAAPDPGRRATRQRKVSQRMAVVDESTRQQVSPKH